MRKYIFIIATILVSVSAYAQQNTAINNTLQEIFQGSDRSCCHLEFKDGEGNINLFNGWQLSADVKVTVGRSSEHGSDNSFVQAPTSPEEDFIDLGPKLGVMPKDMNRSTTVGNKNYPLHYVGVSPSHIAGHSFVSVDLDVVGY